MAQGNTDRDLAAWIEAAKARKFRVEGGQVWTGTAGLLFPVPPVPGFASLPESSQPLVFHAVTQFTTYRVGQTAEGNVAEAVHKSVTDGGLPPVKSNDAFESLYINDIRERVATAHKARVDAAKAAGEDAPSDPTPAMIEATAEKHRAVLFDRVVKAGIAAGLNKPAKGETTAKKPRKTATAVEIAI